MIVLFAALTIASAALLALVICQIIRGRAKRVARRRANARKGML